MLAVKVAIITPDEDTQYLVGPQGELVWTQPAVGDPYILAARSEAERLAAGFVGGLLSMGLVPYGLPLNQRAIVAMFGGSPIRECRWVSHADAPAPTGDAGDTLPTQCAVITGPGATVEAA